MKDPHKIELNSEEDNTAHLTHGLEYFFSSLAEYCRGRKQIPLQQLLDQLQDRAAPFAMLLLVLPNCIPPGIPGFSTVTGIPLILLLVRWMMGKKGLKLPQRLQCKMIDASRLSRLLKKAASWITRAEKILRPRLTGLFSARQRWITGLLMVLDAVILALPIPFANFFSALVLAIILIGVIEHDGYWVLTGYVLSVLLLAAMLGSFIWSGIALGSAFNMG